MSQWITQRGQSMPAISQMDRMECWITCHQMVLQANGIMWDLDTIEQKLVAGGFTQAKACRSSGVDDPDLVKCAQALKMGYNKTSAINSLSGLKIMLQLCGPLWVAGIFPTQNEARKITNYKHIVMLIGIDEEHSKVCWVNPWKNNAYDTASKGWIDWSYIKESIKSTLDIEGSLQYLTPIQAAAVALSQ